MAEKNADALQERDLSHHESHANLQEVRCSSCSERPSGLRHRRPQRQHDCRQHKPGGEKDQRHQRQRCQEIAAINAWSAELREIARLEQPIEAQLIEEEGPGIGWCG